MQPGGAFTLQYLLQQVLYHLHILFRPVSQRLQVCEVAVAQVSILVCILAP